MRLERHLFGTTADDAVIEGLEPIGEPEKTDIYTTPEQLAEGLLTLSLMPRSRWQILLNLETIRVSRTSISQGPGADAATATEQAKGATEGA